MKPLRFLYLIAFLILNSCSSSDSKVDLALEEQILYFGNGTEPKDLDPHTVTGVPESHILMALLEGLVMRHPEGLDPLPAVAESWTISDDGKTYTFKLRENAIWSNGDQVTASDFVWAWERMLTPSLGSKYPDMLYDVVNAEEFNKVHSSCGAKENPCDGHVTFSVEANNDSTITVTDISKSGTNYLVRRQFEGKAEKNGFVTFRSAKSLGGNITAEVLNQEYQIASIISENVYTIEAKDVDGNLVKINSQDIGEGGSKVTTAYRSLKDFTKVGVKSLGMKKLLVELKNPAPYFLGLLAHYTTRPVHRPTIEKFGEIDTIGSKWTRPGNFIGNGPFTLEDWQLNKVLKVKKNNLYWDANRVRLNGIHFFPVDNATREDLMFRNGQLHVTSTVPLEKIEVYSKQYPDLIHIDPYFGTYYLRINVKKAPFDNKLVRKALSLSINRKEIVEKVAKGGQIPAFSFTPPDPNSYFPPTTLEFDPVLAQSLLKEAGVSQEKLPAFEYLYNTSEGHQKLAQAFQQMWKENLNIDVELANTDWKVYLSRQNIGDYTIARAGWIGDYPDPKTFLDMMVTDRGNNQTGWSNYEYDKLLIKAAQSTSQEERFKHFYKAEQILMDELPIIPIYTYTRVYMLNKDVKGWSPNLLDSHPYQYVYLER